MDGRLMEAEAKLTDMLFQYTLGLQMSGLLNKRIAQEEAFH